MTPSRSQLKLDPNLFSKNRRSVSYSLEPTGWVAGKFIFGRRRLTATRPLSEAARYAQLATSKHSLARRTVEESRVLFKRWSWVIGALWAIIYMMG